MAFSKIKYFLVFFILFGSQLNAQRLSARMGILPNDWLHRQGVPAFIEFGAEYALFRNIGVVAAYKFFDGSFEENDAFGRPGAEGIVQLRYYLNIEEFNDGPFFAIPFVFGQQGKYTAVNILDGCEDTYYLDYTKVSAFIGYKTVGRWGAEFFGGPTYRTTTKYRLSTCGDFPGENRVTNVNNKWLLELGVRVTWRIL